MNSSTMALAEPMMLDGHVRIASVSKTFVATVLLQLIAEGRATLEDALERYVRTNSSSVQGHYLLGKARAELGDREGARRSLAEARATFWLVPWFKKRGQTRWWLLALVAGLLV